MRTPNLVILAEVDARNASLTDRILFTTGLIFSSAIVPIRLRELTVNLLDPAGYADLVAEVARSQRVTDGSLLMFDNTIDRLGVRAEPRSFACLLFGR